MNRMPWNAAERRSVRACYPHMRTEDLARILGRTIESLNGIVQKLRLHKSAAYLASPAACRLRRGDNVGAAHRFVKGHVPANKGLRRPGWAPGRMAMTQFKKGDRPHTWVPVGTEVVDLDGYRKRKIANDRTKPSRFNWRFVHVLVWEAKHGQVPLGHAVVFRNGNQADIRIENLECIPRAELMRRNSVHRLPKVLADAIQLRGQLVRRIREREEARA